jgi:hypothetical protein
MHRAREHRARWRLFVRRLRAIKESSRIRLELVLAPGRAEAMGLAVVLVLVLTIL